MSHCPVQHVNAVPSLLVSDGMVRTGEWSIERPRYDHYLFEMVQPFLKGRICEIGSGRGELTQYLSGCDRVTAIEPYGPYHLIAMQRLAYHLNVECVRCALEDCPNARVPKASYDSVVAINLLEHLEYDITALEIMADLTAPAGHVIAVVPAVRTLFGRLDQARGHLRRYDRPTLQRAFHEAGLQVTRSFHFNLAGMIGWWIFSRMLRRPDLSAWVIRGFERGLPTLIRLERTLPTPIGLSLCMIGLRPA